MLLGTGLRHWKILAIFLSFVPWTPVRGVNGVQSKNVQASETPTVAGNEITASDHWAFRTLVPSALPKVVQSGRLRTPIDAYILSQLESHRLEFSPDASQITLIRWASLDLIGLPPSPQEIRLFLQDKTEDAYERLIDRLMASPHFGERWGRHWLDVAGYADTVGFDGNPNDLSLTEGKWRYRDYVIQCFNEDMPYDQFLLEQLAGDEVDNWRTTDVLPPEILRRLIATGYLRTARDQTTEPVSNIPTNFYEVIHDTIEIVGKGLLGLTVNCARCHDHKFDPVLQEDYYRLMAIFTPAYNPDSWKPAISWSKDLEDRTLPDVPLRQAEEIRQHNILIDHKIADLNKQIAAVREPHKSRLFEEKIQSIPESLRMETRTAWETDKNQRNVVQKAIFEKYSKTLTVTDAEVEASITEEEKAVLLKSGGEMEQASKQRRRWNKIQALFDVGPAPSTRLLIGGQHENPDHEVLPGYIQALCEFPDQVQMIPPTIDGTSGRRTALAQWLTTGNTRATGLVGRVMVNRIWMHLFGSGLGSPDADFGVQGMPPVHPELFEWLVLQFQQGPWRIKPLVRRILLSTVYRQASSLRDLNLNPNPATLDPDNRLFWRMPLRRLESEVIRDALLEVSGQFDPAMGGPPVLLKTSPDGRVDIHTEKLAAPADAWRRSVYLVSRRAYHHSLLSVFDHPSIATTCARRDASAVPLQALAMLNDQMVIEVSERLADRVRHAVTSDKERIAEAFLVSLSRNPDAWEVATCLDALETKGPLYRDLEGCSAEVAERRAFVDFCHTLLNTSEFLYVE